jgi:hypothetical protein
MADLWHEWGSDLAIGPTGDLSIVESATLGQQRVLRRLLTNAGGYIWHLEYGGGLGAFVGRAASANEIQSVIRTQMYKEATVSHSPEPQTIVGPAGRSNSGTVSAEIRYTDMDQEEAQVIKFSVPVSPA